MIVIQSLKVVSGKWFSFKVGLCQSVSGRNSNATCRSEDQNQKTHNLWQVKVAIMHINSYHVISTTHSSDMGLSENVGYIPNEIAI